MARALVRNPSLFVFDEPLSNLDAQLRVEMRAEIKQLHARVGTTCVYVTHDQVEAMTKATRIAVGTAARSSSSPIPIRSITAPRTRSSRVSWARRRWTRCRPAWRAMAVGFRR
jgi:ABC-type sugar transport system ATPase subunit